MQMKQQLYNFYFQNNLALLELDSRISTVQDQSNKLMTFLLVSDLNSKEMYLRQYSKDQK